MRKEERDGGREKKREEGKEQGNKLKGKAIKNTFTNIYYVYF